MKIICATDFTPRARAAAKIAVDLARRTAGSVELIHVTAERTVDIQALSMDVGVQEQEIREGIETKLDAESRELAARAEVPVSFHLGAGEAVGVLLARAKAIGADLIVMGAHGRPALERFFLGSTAERMVRCADGPVLIVPPGVEGFGAAGRHERALRIVAALDGRRASEGGIRFVGQLRSRQACDVTFLQLYWPPDEYRRLGLTGRRDLAIPDPDVVRDLERTLRTEVGVLPGIGNMVFAVEPTWGDPASGILAAAGERGCDLLVMGRESRHGWARLAHPPIASQIASQAAGVPVVFVPGPTANPSRSEVPGVYAVLAPTDLSMTGNRAVPFAYSMVAARGGVVELCYVHERDLPNPAYAYDRQEGKLDVEERTRIANALRGLVPADADQLGITTHVTVIDGGKAAEAITQAAERLVVDAIVLGSHGKGGGMRSLLGSVSQAVVHKARRPVLVVPSRLGQESNNAEGDETP
jgi:nucleotide-binding universal stress UspA family protein